MIDWVKYYPKRRGQSDDYSHKIKLRRSEKILVNGDEISIFNLEVPFKREIELTSERIIFKLFFEYKSVENDWISVEERCSWKYDEIDTISVETKNIIKAIQLP